MVLLFVFFLLLLVVMMFCCLMVDTTASEKRDPIPAYLARRSIAHWDYYRWKQSGKTLTIIFSQTLKQKVEALVRSGRLLFCFGLILSEAAIGEKPGSSFAFC